MKKEVKIPDIAENVESGLIASVLVSEGDRVEEDQSLVEVETDKATTDIPSPFAGVVDEIRVSEGDEVKVNQVIMVIETEGEKEEVNGNRPEAESDRPEAKDRSPEAESDRPEAKDQSPEAKSDRPEAKDRSPEAKSDRPEAKDRNPEAKSGRSEAKDRSPEADAGSREAKEDRDPSDIPAAPSVRRRAREMGIDLFSLKGTGPGGRITTDDLEQAVKEGPKATAGEKEKAEAAYGPESRESMKNIRKLTAESMSEAWTTIPHVTQFDQADLTKLEEFRQKTKSAVEKGGGKLTITALLLKIAAYALQKFPEFNASIDTENMEIVYKHYIHIGVAVDTSRGLLVPVVRDVNRKSLTELSARLGELAQKARDKKISPDELKGGTFTVSNLGGIGGNGFTPIVYPPQVAILGVSRASYQQVYLDEAFQKRLILPLSLSYDHRVIDGADGARFLRWICDVIEDPFAILF